MQVVEVILREYLKEITAVPVYLEEPEKPPKEYIIIDKLGSGEDNLISSASVAIQSYSDSLYGAAWLNRQVKTAMRNIVALDTVAAAKLNSDYNYTDTQTKRYRYQAVYNITYYDQEGL